MTGRGTIIVVAKAPVPGSVKTRLCPPFTMGAAAELASAALADTLAAVSAARCMRRVVAFEGDPHPWVPRGFDVMAQPSGGLDARLASAFRAVRGRTILIGMDTPQVKPALLERALELLGRHDAVLGPAWDGGYWLVGLGRPDERAFLGIPMSAGTTCVAQHTRLAELGLRTGILATLRDVDHYEDAAAVAAGAPLTNFASAFREAAGRIVAGSTA